MSSEFVILYRWRLKPERVEQFRRAWTKVTRIYLEEFGSHGSRLHKGNDGIWYAYAQWPSAEARENASGAAAVATSMRAMAGAIEERLPEVELEIVEDLII